MELEEKCSGSVTNRHCQAVKTEQMEAIKEEKEILPSRTNSTSPLPFHLTNNDTSLNSESKMSSIISCENGMGNGSLQFSDDPSDMCLQACSMCGDEVTRLRQHVSSKHGMSMAEYRKEHPDVIYAKQVYHR